MPVVQDPLHRVGPELFGRGAESEEFPGQGVDMGGYPKVGSSHVLTNGVPSLLIGAAGRVHDKWKRGIVRLLIDVDHAVTGKVEKSFPKIKVNSPS